MVHANARWSGHPLSAAGIVLTTVSATLFLSLWALDAAGWIRNPYVGLLAFIAIPALFVTGLVLIPIGAWLGRRRARRGLEAVPRWPRIDLNDRRARRPALLIVLATVVNVLLIVAAGTEAVNYLDSPAFCGGMCHTPMQPQFVQWQHAPHARIACVDCHVGTELGSFVKAISAHDTRQPSTTAPSSRLADLSSSDAGACNAIRISTAATIHPAESSSGRR